MQKVHIDGNVARVLNLLIFFGGVRLGGHFLGHLSEMVLAYNFNIYYSIIFFGSSPKNQVVGCNCDESVISYKQKQIKTLYFPSPLVMKARDSLELMDSSEIISSPSPKSKVKLYKKVIDGQQYAIKSIRKHKQSPNREVQICKQIMGSRSQNLVRIHDCWDNPSEYFIQMQFYPFNLQGYVRQRSHQLVENPHIGISILLQICFGIFQLQLLHHTHRDLKSTNILVKEENARVKVVLADFAECNNGEFLNNSNVGTPFFMAPQIKAIKTLKSYSSKVDVWSLGIIIFEIYSVFQPSQDPDNKLPQFPQSLNKYFRQRNLSDEEYKLFTHLMKQQKPIISKKVPGLVKSIMQVILEVDPHRRPSFEEICSYLHDNKQAIKNCFPDPVQAAYMGRKLEQLAATGNNPFGSKLQKMKSLLNNFYKPISSKVNLERNKYQKLYLFIYYGLKKICDIYEQNRTIMREELWISQVFEDQNCKKFLMCQKLRLKNELNSKKTDSQLQEQLAGSKLSLVRNPKIAKILKNYFNQDQVDQLFKEYEQIYDE